MNLNTDGLIIREKASGEQNKTVTVLTRDDGIVRAYVYGAKKIGSRTSAATQLFAFSELGFKESRGSYIIEAAKPKEVFFGLRNDVKKIALAQYFAELCECLAPENENTEEYLKLILNSLKLLTDEKRDEKLIKSVFELTILSLSGYMPNIVACQECGKYEDEYMYFDTQNGNIFCDKCGTFGMRVPVSVISAVRFVLLSERKKIFNFNLSDANLQALCDLTEKYTLSTLQRKFKTLDFYHMI